jgi:hypothetical protein
MEADQKPLNVASAAVKFPSKPGKTLPNGAIILDEIVVRRYEYRRDSVVLAINPGGVHPFVSWHRMITTDSPLATGGFTTVDSTSYGQYSTNLEDALKLFANRVLRFEEILDLADANDEGKERLRLESL